MHVYVCKNITNFIKKRADIQDQKNKRKHNPKGSITSINMTIYVLQVKIKFRMKYFNQGRSMGRGQVPSPRPPPKFFAPKSRNMHA